MSDTATTTTTTTATTYARGNEPIWTEPFPCNDCGQSTRPPKRKALDPGMENTRGYGGRGRCTTCYKAMDLPPRALRTTTSLGPSPVMLDYTKQTLNSFMQRRQQRLMAGSTAVVVDAKYGPRQAVARPVLQRVSA